MGGWGLGEGDNAPWGRKGWLKRDAAHDCNRGLSSIDRSMQGRRGHCQAPETSYWERSGDIRVLAASAMTGCRSPVDMFVARQDAANPHPPKPSCWSPVTWRSGMRVGGWAGPGPLQSGAFLRQAPAGIGPVAAPLSAPISWMGSAMLPGVRASGPPQAQAPGERWLPRRPADPARQPAGSPAR